VTAGRVTAICLALTLSGCELSMTHQRKYTTYDTSDFWADGASARPLPEGVASQNERERDAIAARPPPISPKFLVRGRERFDIFCAPCHGLAGDGDGIIVARGFPKPPSYHGAALLTAPARHLYDVITDGYGVMFSYGARVEPQDRWAIVAYIRALQLSRRGVPIASSTKTQEKRR
jgi:mono/diheme cytochrome c family protein